MKCPWKELIHVHKDGMGNLYRDVGWDECYKEECPFYAKDERRKKSEMCLRPYRDEGI